MAVSAASLNFGDIARCRGGVGGVMAQPPFTLGMDVAAWSRPPATAPRSGSGRRVVGITPQSLGGMAEHALAGSVFDAPPELDDVEAAAFTLPFHIGYLALHERAALQAGETVRRPRRRQRGRHGGDPARRRRRRPRDRDRRRARQGRLCRDLGAEVAIDHTVRGRVRRGHGRTPTAAAPR